MHHLRTSLLVQRDLIVLHAYLFEISPNPLPLLILPYFGQRGEEVLKEENWILMKSWMVMCGNCVIHRTLHSFGRGMHEVMLPYDMARC